MIRIMLNKILEILSNRYVSNLMTLIKYANTLRYKIYFKVF